MKHIAITGANGYIGRKVTERLLDMGYTVTAVDINTNNIDLRSNIIRYDIFDDNKNVYIDFGKPDILLHLAWVDGFNHSSLNHLEYIKKHYIFLKNMIDGGLKHIAIMGSMHEVGYYEGAIDENTPCNPMSLYGISKNTLRQLILVLNKDDKFIFQWLRGFYLYGDDYYNNSVFKKILDAEKNSNTYFPLNSGKNKYDFIHIDDFTTEIVYSILQENITGIINCCSGKAVTLRDKVEEFVNENNLKIKIEYGKFPDRPYDSPLIFGDVTKIKKIISESYANKQYDKYLERLAKEFNEK